VLYHGALREPLAADIVSQGKGFMEDAVRFANAQYYESEEGLVWFTAFSRNHVIPCAIEVAALESCFNASVKAPLAAFSRARHSIEQIAAELVKEERFADDGSVRIDARDCQRFQRARRTFASAPAEMRC